MSMTTVTRADPKFPPLSIVPLDYNRYRPEEVVRWRAALDAFGFVVLREVLSPREVRTGTKLLWDLLEKLSDCNRHDTKTWDDNWPLESLHLGMIQQNAVHCEGAWYVRGLPGVRLGFAQLWGTPDLHVSFDGICAIRPQGWLGPIHRDWYHVDQSFRRRGRWLVQGFVSLTRSGPEDGGFVVWPCSHRSFASCWGTGDKGNRFGDFESLQLHPEARMPKDTRGFGPVKVCCEAGDLILWDSRTIHCNAPVGPIPGVADEFPKLTDLGRIAPSLSRKEQWSALPRLPRVTGILCPCSTCQEPPYTENTTPLGRLGVYVCMQPARRTGLSRPQREKLLRSQVWTGHVPFREPVAGQVELLPIPEIVERCLVRRALTGLE